MRRCIAANIMDGYRAERCKILWRDQSTSRGIVAAGQLNVAKVLASPVREVTPSFGITDIR